jgi:hypothetical protein
LNERLIGSDGKRASAKLKDFKGILGNGSAISEIQALKSKVIEFAEKFQNIGF